MMSQLGSLSHDLGSQLTEPEQQKISRDRDNIQSRLGSLTNGKMMRYILAFTTIIQLPLVTCTRLQASVLIVRPRLHPDCKATPPS